MSDNTGASIAPRGAYEPLTKEKIERIRVTFQAFSSDADQAKRLTTLFDMAISSLLFAEEIHRLRDRPITDNDRRWRHLEHGCQWVSWTEIGGETHSFDPRAVPPLQQMRACADEQSTKQVRRLLEEADRLARQFPRRPDDGGA